MVRATFFRTRSNPARRYGTNKWGKPLTIERPPKFITDRKPVYYDHLPRRIVSNEDDGTLSDRIGWVIIHPDLVGHVGQRLHKIPGAMELVSAYRALARAAPSYSVLVHYNEKVGAPKSEKNHAAMVAQEAYQATIEGAEKVIGLLSTPTVAHALSDLLPLRSQHARNFNTRYVVWPRRIDDYPKPKNTEKDKEAEEQESWPSPASYDPWRMSPPLGNEEWSDQSPRSTNTDKSCLPVLPLTPATNESLNPSCYGDDDKSLDSSCYGDDETSLPELENLEVRSIDEVAEEEPPTLLVATSNPTPPPSPPPSNEKIDIVNPFKFPILRRGNLSKGERLLAITDERVLIIRNDLYPYTIEDLKECYEYHYPNATEATVTRACIYIDHVYAEFRGFIVEEVFAPARKHIPYREALHISAEKGAAWDGLGGMLSDNSMIHTIVVAITPTKIPTIPYIEE